MGRGNGQRLPRFYHIGFYHAGYVYVIRGEYGPVVRVKANSTAEFENFDAEWKAWAAAGYREDYTDAHHGTLSKMFSAYISATGEKRYDFQEEKRKLESAKRQASIMSVPSHTDYHPPRISRVCIEYGSVVTYWEDGERLSVVA
jgi:hypothetical protein